MVETRRKPIWLSLWATATAALLILPGLVVIPMSFNGHESFAFPPVGVGTRWYQEFFSNPAWIGALLHSLETAVIVAVLATVIGTAAAFGFVRHEFPGKKIALLLVLAPMVTPIVVIAVADYAKFLSWHLVGSLPGFIIANTVIAVPYVVVTVSAPLTTVGKHLELAASSLGAPPRQVVRRITLPLIAAGIGAGAIFAFMASFDETVIAIFISDPNFTTLPAQMYASVTREINPTIASASSIIMAISTALLIASVTVFRSRYGKRQ